jgi:hypothetical protein
VRHLRAVGVDRARVAFLEPAATFPRSFATGAPKRWIGTSREERLTSDDRWTMVEAVTHFEPSLDFRVDRSRI